MKLHLILDNIVKNSEEFYKKDLLIRGNWFINNGWNLIGNRLYSKIIPDYYYSLEQILI